MLKNLVDERAACATRLAELDRLIAHPMLAVHQAAPSEDDETLLDIPAVAERLGFKASNVYALARRRGIPSVRVGKFIRIRESVVREIETGKRCIDA